MKTGLSVNTPDRVVFGPGEVFVDFDEEYMTGTSLGATRGGSEFNPNRTIRDIAVDGVPGPVSQLRKRDTVAPTLTVRLLEITSANLTRAIAGAIEDVDGNIIGQEITSEAFLENVALVAEDTAGNEVVFILYNALATTVNPIATPDKGEVVLEVVFTGHFDLTDPETEPWKIIPIQEGS